tara:strand:+ start:351 stop:500 length:150 start_codon:yes stop_codon:yes gene_type:complete
MLLTKIEYHKTVPDADGEQGHQNIIDRSLLLEAKESEEENKCGNEHAQV